MLKVYFLDLCYELTLADIQPYFFTIRSMEAGFLINAAAGLIGRITRFPEQLGQTKFKILFTQ